MLRLLMDQYDLGVADLPEIGSKSMVSRVLSGERSLNKKHITALSERFGINPGFFSNVQIRCTQKLLKELGIKNTQLADIEQNSQHCWATGMPTYLLWIDEKHCCA